MTKTAQMNVRSASSLATLEGANVVDDLKNEHSRIAGAKKSTSELLRSLFVYKMCSWSLLVDLAPMLIRLAEWVHFTLLVYWIVRKTFFTQFCGGETAEDCVDTMNSFKQAGINSILDLSILDLSIEAALDDSDLAQGNLKPETRARFNKSADDVASSVSTCIATASAMPKSFVAIKVTALVSPLLLQKISNTLNAMEHCFRSLDQDGDGRMSLREFGTWMSMLPSPTATVQPDASLETIVERLFREADKDGDGYVDWVDVACTISLSRKETQAVFTAEQSASNKLELIPGLCSEDLEDYRRLLKRVERLCDQAKEAQTRLMMDAEQTYFQPAIDAMTLHLQERYNRTRHPGGPLIYNTYQMYLKDALGRLQRDFARAQRNDYVLAVKLVRGAYMVSERKRALELGLEDPICNGIEATHHSFNAGLDFVLTELARPLRQGAVSEQGVDHQGSCMQPTLSSSRVLLVVASHNMDSTIRTCEQMQELGLEPRSGLVMFGQLKGMCDHMSYTLGMHGYGVYKYVPYGPIHHVIPYLIRRAQENASVLEGAVVERALIWEELQRRVLASMRLQEHSK
ncbi:hypothetical protein BGZ67_001485 [Mortierella alpina]|nr:hypothetical protein BGZ67_001485 [Mortierella alpina]